MSSPLICLRQGKVTQNSSPLFRYLMIVMSILGHIWKWGMTSMRELSHYLGSKSNLGYTFWKGHFFLRDWSKRWNHLIMIYGKLPQAMAHSLSLAAAPAADAGCWLGHWYHVRLRRLRKPGRDRDQWDDETVILTSSAKNIGRWEYFWHGNGHEIGFGIRKRHFEQPRFSSMPLNDSPDQQ